MQLRTHRAHCALLLLCVLLTSCSSLSNRHAELRPTRAGAAHSSQSLNRARTGGRREAAADRGADQSPIGCRELRSTKYISDGHCTSINPIKELVCAGECLPAQVLENWIGGAPGRKFWARRSGGDDWRCVNDKTRTQRIRLQCQDGSRRTYKITVVTSCKCKRYSRQHNESAGKVEDPRRAEVLQKHKSRRRLGKSPLRENRHESRA